MNILSCITEMCKPKTCLSSPGPRGWLAICLGLLVNGTMASRAQEWGWVQRSGGSATDTGNAIVADGHGHLYTAGTFEGVTQFGSQNLTVEGNCDGFIAQWSVSSNLNWVLPVGGSNSDSVASLAIDPQAHLIALGFTKSAQVVCGGLTVTNKWARDYSSLFLSKLDASGKATWLQLIGGGGVNQMAGVDTDASGNIYMAAWMARFANFGVTNLTGYEDILIAKFDPDGNLLWAKSAGGNGYDYGQSLAVTADGHVYVSGYFEKTASFDSFKVTSRGGSDGFLARYDTDGNVQWVSQIGGTYSFDTGGRLAAAPDGGVYMTGGFAGSATIGTNTLTSSGGTYDVDLYFARFNGAGNVLWAQSMGMIGAESIGSVAVNVTTNGTALSTNIYLTGGFIQNTRVGSIQLTNTTAQRVFVTRWDPEGNVLWARQCGGGSGFLALDQNPDPTVYLLSNFTDPSAWRNVLLTSRGNTDVVVAQLLPALVPAPGAPPVIHPIQTSMDVPLGASFLLEAEVTTTMPATFQWRKYGATLVDAARLSGTKTTRFTIQTALTNDVGRYDLIVKNDFGATTSAVCQVTISSPSDTGAPLWDWVRIMGGTRSDSVTRLVTDANGRTTVMGQFEGTNTIGQTVLVSSPNNRTMFLAQYDALGMPRWATQSVGSKTDTPTGLAVDVSGNLYVVGYFNSTNLMLGSSALANFAQGYNDVFVAKYNAQGVLQWAKSFGGDRDDYARAIAVDGQGNVVIVGDFNSATITCDDIITPNIGGRDVFTVKLDAQGKVQWVRTAGDSGLHEGYAITVDAASNIYVAGKIWSQIQFDTYQFDSHFDSDTFLVSYNSNGNVRWARQFGNFSIALPRSIAVDSQQRVLMTGYFDQSFDLDGHPLICHGSQDTFVAQFNADGKALWALALGGPGMDTPKDMAIDSQDRMCVTGSFAQTAWFGDVFLAGGAQRNAYIAMLDSTGRVLWAKQTGGSRATDGNTLAVGPDGALMLGGSFSSSVSFDAVSYQAMESSMDGFVARLLPFSQQASVSLRMLRSRAIEIRDATGKTITIQSTPSLRAPATWQDRTNFVPSTSPAFWTDSTTPSSSAQFYRARITP